MGQPNWFYGFYNQPYYADRYFAWVSRSRHQEVQTSWEGTSKKRLGQSRVEYLIIDSDLYNRMLTRPNALNALPVEEVLLFLRNKCVEVAVIPEEDSVDDHTKMTRIYRVNG